MLNKQRTLLALPLALTILTLSPWTLSDTQPGSTYAAAKFDRSQSMLVNLKTAPMSAGYYLIHSYGNTKVMNRDLERALNQIVEVDKAYAKSRHKPDSRYLENVCLRVTVARQTAEQLEQQLRDAYSELKSAIEEAIVTDSNFK
jgi:hypothetical protein